MTVMDIIRDLEEKGFKLDFDGEDLNFSYPKSAAPNTVAKLRQKLKQNKNRLVEYLIGQGQGREQRPAKAMADKKQGLTSTPPIIWETGNIAQIRSLLVLREAELVLAESQLTGDDYVDWRVKNKVLDLEMKITTLRKWLAEARNDNDGG
ncbi:hypothetical protein ES707_06316 [subsurface metagenome]